MSLPSAEIYTGVGEVLERTASVPDLGAGSLVVVAGKHAGRSPAPACPGTPGLRSGCRRWSTGASKRQLRIAPISHGGELLGLIVVKRPPTGDSFSEDDDRVLADLARQVGLACTTPSSTPRCRPRSTRCASRPTSSASRRARIVASGDAERRRVERNLHDGAQQHLVALAVNLRLTRDIIVDDPDAGVEMLDQLAEEVKETIQELRELAHGIYPPLLVDSGLVEALKAAANRSPLPSASSPKASAGTRPRSKRRSTSVA